MKNFIKIFVPIILVLLLVSPIHSNKETRLNDLVILSKNFYLKMRKTPSIQRDDFLNSNLNKVVQTRGTIIRIDHEGRYDKKFRIVLVDQVAKYVKLNIEYYIFIDDEDSVKMLTENEIFEFSGQLTACTPTNTRRDSYIFDIIFEKGAMIVQ
jgi:hypothetical protein